MALAWPAYAQCKDGWIVAVKYRNTMWQLGGTGTAVLHKVLHTIPRTLGGFLKLLVWYRSDGPWSWYSTVRMVLQLVDEYMTHGRPPPAAAAAIRAG